MKNKLLETAINKNILDPYQFAYQHNLGVEDALLTAINLISTHLDNSSQNYCRILYVDFSSAFNAMQTKILIEKMNQLNFPEYMINWYHDFLTERPQYVKLNTQTSSIRVLLNGCPQGCVSSPLLYILYTNDCVSTEDNCTIIKYADDTAIIGLLNSQTPEDKYMNEIDHFTAWCSENKLELNVTKTKEQIFDFRRDKPPAEQIRINDQNVEIVKQFKYLGITIDDDLRFRSHTANVIKKCNQRLHILRKLNSFKVRAETLLQIYKSLVLSLMTYGLTVWYSGCGVKEKALLQKTIQHAAKIINKKLDPLAHSHSGAVERKAFKIVNQRKHPLHSEFFLLNSGKRYRESKCRTNRHKLTFIPTAIKAINACYSKSKPIASSKPPP